MKIGSVIVNFFVFYEHDDDTSKYCTTTTKMDLQGPHFNRGTLGGEKDMRETRVDWTEFTWFLITYVLVIFDLTTS